jgi:hypothetical protein
MKALAVRILQGPFQLLAVMVNGNGGDDSQGDKYWVFP